MRLLQLQTALNPIISTLNKFFCIATSYVRNGRTNRFEDFGAMPHCLKVNGDVHYYIRGDIQSARGAIGYFTYEGLEATGRIENHINEYNAQHQVHIDQNLAIGKIKHLLKFIS
jgi:hypothetical protein